jgi:hypothetical protein
MKTQSWRKRCPVCHRWVTSRNNYIYSFRLMPSGKYRLVELCRSCRDKGA